MLVFHQQKYIFLRRYVFPIIVAALILFSANIAAVKFIRSHYLDLMEERSVSLAEGYVQSIAKASEARATIEELLSHHLLAAGRTIASYEFIPTGDQELVDLADIMGVDVIYLYDLEGTIVHSSGGQYIGWQTYPGHPVHDFWEGALEGYVEDIRPDSDSGELFKYAYFMNPNGGFVQLGIAAERVDRLLENFEIGTALSDIASSAHISEVLLFDQDSGAVIGQAPLTNSISVAPLGTHAKEILSREGVVAGTDIVPELTGYQVLIPIEIDKHQAGVLLLNHTMDRMNQLIQRGVGMFGVALALVFAIVAVSLWLMYRQNLRLVGLAYVDPRTELPNRTFLTELLIERLGQTKRKPFAVVLLDCGNFSGLTLNHGYQFTDRLLRQIGDRLKYWPEQGQRWVRFNSAQFMLLIDQYESHDYLKQLAESIEPFLRSEDVIQTPPVPAILELRLGVVTVTDTYHRVDDIFRDASITLSTHASPFNADGIRFFDTGFRDQMNRDRQIEEDMRAFLEGHSEEIFSLQYQPKVRGESGTIIGFEALARMHSPLLGPVSPLEFIPLAEKHHLILPFGLWVLRKAARFAAQLKRKDLSIAVNVSGLQLLQDGFVNAVKQILWEEGLLPEQIELEITESVFLEQPQTAVSVLSELRSLGLRTVIDDFGTGYSSLARLEDLPVDGIKLDRSFVQRIDPNRPKPLIVGELIGLCRTLGLQVVAEGVETAHQQRYLLDKGCSFFQGFFFYRPLDEEQALRVAMDPHADYDASLHVER